MTFEELRENVRAQRQRCHALERDVQRAQETLRTLAVRKALLERLGLQASTEFQTIAVRERQLNERLPVLQGELRQAQAAAHTLLADLTTFARPQEAVEQLDDQTPFLLLPVRLETRFQHVPTAAGGLQPELWLRIYPDDIHVDTHEETLTEDEIVAAAIYWTEVWRAGGDAARELGAWRALMRKYGAPRAAWIVRVYRPNNEFDASGNSNRPAAPLQDTEVLDPAPTFDPYDAKQDSWSRAPRVTTLPDRFVAMGFIGNEKVFEHEGNPIPDPLIVGPNPALPAHEGFGATAEGFDVDAEMRWMVDFEEAVRVGMGMRIRLNPPAAGGVDRLLVLGLRLSSDATEGQALLESLIEAHHYSADGFSVVPQGTATNNTGAGGAGFRSFDLGDDDSFHLELGKPLFANEPDWQQQRDGQHLAEALGINPDVFHHIQFSDGFDHRDARAMNTALWPATLGYFLEEMMEPLFAEETLHQTRQFFLQHVSGRGPVPAIRDGTQPYGILPTSALSRWRYPSAIIGNQIIYPFEKYLYDVLMRLDQEWNKLVPRISHAGRAGDAQQNLLDILGLHASSAEFYRRFAVSLEQLHNMLKLQQFDPVALNLDMFLRNAWFGIAQDFGADVGERPNILTTIFYQAQTALTGPLVDDAPLSETEAVQALSQDGENYLAWLATSPIDTIRRQDFGKQDDQNIPPPRALLYLMLRHAVMNAYWDAAWNFYFTAELTAQAPRQEPKILYVSADNPGQSKLAILYRPAGELSEKHPAVFPDATLTVAEQMSHPDIIRARLESQHLHEVREALTYLQQRPTQVLARAFSEHLDLCSYRLDAWLLGVVNQRLFELRGAGHDVRQGIYLGAFGWLEQVRPEQALQPFQGTAPPEFLDPADPPLQVALDNGGYIHGPSLNHAVTAAVLRNAYITHADQDHASVAAVNLTSERVRTALAMVEGVQNGQELGALLGYQFERGLHDRYDQAEVDQFILKLREKFPLGGNRLHTTEDYEPIEAIEARNVIDGLALIRHIQAADADAKVYPFGLDGLPVANPEQAAAIKAEVGRLKDTMDAVSDLFIAESVYQAVQGNFDRAGAVLDALSKTENLPEPDIVRTPRSGVVMTHRLCLQFATDIPESQRNPYQGDIPLTPRAQAEPGVNRWLASLLGEEATAFVSKVVVIEEGAGPAGEDVEHTHTVSLKDLQLQPLDLLYILDQDLQPQQSELDSLIAFALKRREGLPQEASIRIEYTTPVPDKVTFFELMPLLTCLKSLVVDARALNAADLILPSDAAQDLDPNATPDDNPKGWRVSDIQMRVEAARDRLAELNTDLENAQHALLEPIPAAEDFAIMRDALMRAAAFGVQQAIPASAIEETMAAAQALSSQSAIVIQRITERLQAYEALLPIAEDASIDAQVAMWLAAGRSIFGASFTWVPAFTLKLPDEIGKAHADSDHILRHARSQTDFPVDDWLHGVARVRPKARGLETSLLLTDNFGTAVPVLTPMQLPYRSDDFWLAVDYPSDYDFDADRLLVTTVFAAPLDTGTPQAGLLLDEWTEVVPTRNETTGIAFHYDAPNTEPPQTLLLAVTPEVTGHWQWDDLVATLHETLDMAKKRAVEPQHLDDTVLAHFLPAVMIPVTRYLITVATNLAVNVGVGDALPTVPLGPDGE
jgi:hypothetical protein